MIKANHGLECCRSKVLELFEFKSTKKIKIWKYETVVDIDYKKYSRICAKHLEMMTKSRTKTKIFTAKRLRKPHFGQKIFSTAKQYALGYEFVRSILPNFIIFQSCLHSYLNTF